MRIFISISPFVSSAAATAAELQIRIIYSTSIYFSLNKNIGMVTAFSKLNLSEFPSVVNKTFVYIANAGLLLTDVFL